MTIKSRILLALTAATMGIATLAGTALAGDERGVYLPDPPPVKIYGEPHTPLVDETMRFIDKAIRDAVARAAQAVDDAADAADDVEPVCVESDTVGRKCTGPIDGGVLGPIDVGVGPVKDCAEDLSACAAGIADGVLGPIDVGVGPVKDCDTTRSVQRCLKGVVGEPALPVPVPSPGDMEGPLALNGI